jgi:uncharacterized protein (DUF2252 family)
MSGLADVRPLRDSVQAYHSWLSSHPPVLAAELDERAQKMAEDAFTFLRATFYRWAQCFGSVCPELGDAPVVLGIGDLHIENFGSWPLGEHQVAWGVNDFDECCAVPYTADLLRLVVSALLADDRWSATQVVDWVLSGYRGRLHTGPAAPLRVGHELGDEISDAIQERQHKSQHHFADKYGTAAMVAPGQPREAVEFLQDTLRPDADDAPLRHRDAGCGSLGRVRLMAFPINEAKDKAIEVKRCLPSGWLWAMARGPSGTHEPQGGNVYQRVLLHACRDVLDPSIALHRYNRWALRALTPDRVRVELVDKGKDGVTYFKNPEALLTAMGVATANVHLADPLAGTAVADHLPDVEGQLASAAERMTEFTAAEYEAWRSSA